MNKTPVEAFEWLLASYKAYTQNKISWIEVKRVMTEAQDLSEKFKKEADIAEEIYDMNLFA